MFTNTTLEECECLGQEGGVGPQSIISNLIAAQRKSTAKLKRLNALLTQRDGGNTRLKAELQMALNGDCTSTRESSTEN